MKVRSVLTEAVVLKRSSFGEADRMVTIFSKEQGKIACVAKGVRKMNSSRRAYLEPGNYIKVQLITTGSLPILSQATLLSDCSSIHHNLVKIRQLVQFLEIIDTLFVEEQPESELFELLLKTRDLILKEQPTGAKVKKQLEELLVSLGYQHPKDTKYQSILEYVSHLADKPLRSWEYLKLDPST